MIGLTAQQMVYEAKIFFEDIASNNAPSFTNREWSVILTNAQAQIVQEIYDSGYDNNEENRLAIQNLLREYEQNTFTNGAFTNSWVLNLPDELMFISYEECDGKQVRAVSYDSYFNNINNPFKKPSNSVVWRLIGLNGSNIIISTTEPDKYYNYYISRPEPIIIETLDSSKAIEKNKFLQADCKLHPNVHRKIASTAAKIAFASVQEQAGYQIQSLESNKT